MAELIVTKEVRKKRYLSQKCLRELIAGNYIRGAEHAKSSGTLVTASLAFGSLLLRSLDTIGSRDVILVTSPHTERKRTSRTVSFNR